MKHFSINEQPQHLSDNLSESFFNSLLKSHEALIKGEENFIATLANTCALIYHNVPDLNWVGFYLQDAKCMDQLVLAPFQGKIACTRIPIGQGVCGTSFLQRKTLLVADVHKFEGHIACDSASASEIVIPLYQQNQLIGVLDVDSPILNRFGASEQHFFEAIVMNLNTHFECAF